MRSLFLSELLMTFLKAKTVLEALILVHVAPNSSYVIVLLGLTDLEQTRLDAGWRRQGAAQGTTRPHKWGPAMEVLPLVG
jgi:hypothetical protein